MVETSALHIVDFIVQQAVQRCASDIHMEPTLHGLRIRFRCDGFLSDEMTVLSDYAQQVISRIKLVAHLDVSEKRVPQDGTWRYAYDNRTIDVRVATFPSLYGEKLVLRLLHHHEEQYLLHELGFDAQHVEQLTALMKRPQGFFLVTGPTGSGKTTTLYAMLSLLRSADRNIVTLEDPIEYRIAGITQSHIRPDIGFTFASGIRALLRQDPDVIMVGEIRDAETAAVSVQAALTGHVVLSTLHTNNAVSSIIRLLDMGVPAYLIAATVTALIAQRLVRVLCVACKYSDAPSEEEKTYLRQLNSSLATIYRARGCKACRLTGYAGRRGICELFIISPAIREFMQQKIISYNALHELAVREGMRTLSEHARELIQNGTTTISEVVRVLG